MKVSFHAGRQSGCANHNDRNYDYEKDAHIDKGKVKDNIYIGKEDGENFRDLELNYYKKNFSSWLKEQNKKNVEARHQNRNRTIEDLYQGKNTRPEEVIFQIGNHEEKFTDGEMFEVIVRDYIEQFEELYGKNCKVLDVAIHMDEDNIHAHIRRVWFAEGEQGKEISQRKALEELKIERPDTSISESRYNNPKITLTKDERKMIIEICKEHGVNVEKTMHGQKKIQMQKLRQQALESEIKKLENELEALKKEHINIDKLKSLIGREESDELELYITNAERLKNENISLKEENKKLKDEINTTKQDLSNLYQQTHDGMLRLEYYEKIKRRNKAFREILEKEELHSRIQTRQNGDVEL